MTAFILALFLQASGPIDQIKAGQQVTRLTVGTYTLTEPLKIPSFTTILCDPGATFEAAPDSFPGHNDVLIDLTNSANVTIIGCTFKGPPPMPEAEGRHAIWMRGSWNIRLIDVTVEGSGGDGCAIDPFVDGMFTEDRYPSHDIQIDRMKSTSNYRTGLSISSCVNCTVRDSEFNDTKGRSTNSGFLVEPNHGGDKASGILVERCKASNNAGSAFRVNMDRQNQVSKPIDITFKDCTGEKIPLSWQLIQVDEYGSNQGLSKPLGLIKWDSSTWENR